MFAARHKPQAAASHREHPASDVSGNDTNLTAQLPLSFTRTKRRPQHPYYNTTPLTHEQLAGAMRVAEQQDELVLAIFRAIPGPLSPSQVWAIGQGYGKAWLLTSVRRSITNLPDPNYGALVRLNTTRMGPHGRPEHCWALPAKAMAA